MTKKSRIASLIDMDDEMVFKALADASRRTLLDALFERDGQTLSELQAHLTTMTRFGVMKHLQVLEDAGLVTTRKVGREKFHYLNPVPIQLAYDRWVSKYAQPWSQALTGFKFAVEGEIMNAQPTHVYSIVIASTPERIWQALTDGSMSEKYYFGTRVQSTWQAGAPYQYIDTQGGVVASGEAMITGDVIESDPPRKLVTTFIPLWGDGLRNAPSRVTFEIEPRGAVCKLTLTHEDLGTGHVGAGIIDGWTTILSGMKTLLETNSVLSLSTAQA
ncbi:MAG: SRPBCC domain-containing protein [Chloroflexota bacterium]|nr:SRPBCC domain-containing protein [Chloroflexota bacterium]